jgi:ketosteroid isomerase-like protein
MIEMETPTQDSAELSKLNRQFIENFTRQDAARHDEIIHKDFVCIQVDGSIVGREDYIRGWSTAYTHSNYTDFSYTDESIRIFGDIALVRSKTVYTKKIGDKEVKGNSIYTDTYVKENHRWKCIQAQITPVAAK